MKIKYEMPKCFMEVMEKYGTILTDIDGVKYYNLPQWFIREDGIVYEIPSNELPQQIKEYDSRD